jgi:hypothetical protein
LFVVNSLIRAFLVLSFLCFFPLFGGKSFEQFKSNLGDIEKVEIKNGSPSLSETFQDSFVVPELPVEEQINKNVNSDADVPEGIEEKDNDTLKNSSEAPEEKIQNQVTTAPLLDNTDESASSTEPIITAPVQPVEVGAEESSKILAGTELAEENMTGLANKSLPVEESNSTQTADNQDETQPEQSQTIDPDALPFLTSDFFAGSLAGATTEQDPMGTQRLLQVKNSRFSPSLLAGTSFKHTSNPDKAENPQRKNSTTLDLTIGVNLGLGEYAVGDYFVCAPAASLMQMRTYNDPLQKFDKDMRVYDADVFIAGLTAPLVLPNDYTLTLSHSYVAPSTFRGGRNLISYSNTPTVTLTKNLPMEDGNMLILVAGMSYTFSSGDTLEEQIADPVYFNFLNAVMGGSASDDYPANLQDGYTFMLSASYMIPYSERISIIPTISYQSFSFTEGMNDGRVDKTLNLGVSASYLWYEWLSLSLMANYTTKTSSDINTPEFDDFIFGGGINVNHSF